jgi:uncharacterized protein (DUF779 family)
VVNPQNTSTMPVDADTHDPPSVLEARPEVPGESTSRVSMTAAARDLIVSLWDRNGPLMFHQSGGCCDGSSPMCFPAGEFLTGDADVLLGTFEIPTEVFSAAGVDPGGAPAELPFWMSREQFGYWRHTHLTLDVVPGRGSGFSLESPEGVRFLIRSQLMDGLTDDRVTGVR